MTQSLAPAAGLPLSTDYLPIIEAELRRNLDVADPAVARHYWMIQYHMGWLDENFQPVEANVGKRLRPLLCLLSAAAVDGEPEQALPAAAAVEILHNFSLVHDDIEDRSPTRRHRATVWKLWGDALAINVGDAMFTLAHRALHRLPDVGHDHRRAWEAVRIFNQGCLRLTEGQYLDMSFEQRLDVTPEEYLTMIEGKTAALLAVTMQLGALLGGATQEVCARFACFGAALGRAFQIRDDILGVWGRAHQTGKSSQSDILARKKTLPVVYALRGGTAAGRKLQELYSSELHPEAIPEVLACLEETGAQVYAHNLEEQARGEALRSFEATGCDNPAAHELRVWVNLLAGRES